MNPNRKAWNDQQQLLQKALAKPADFQQAIALFLRHHAMVHASEMSGTGLWSFEDEIWQDTSEETARRIPPGCDHSIAWNIWHIARIEDITMNLLVAGTPQLALTAGWLDRMQVSYRHAGNAMSDEDIKSLSATINIDALRAYRIAVGRRTREIVQRLQPEELKRKVDPIRLQRISDERAVVEAAGEIIAYWGGRTIAGLLLMPATRHNFLHLNEALRLKSKRS